MPNYYEDAGPSAEAAAPKEDAASDSNVATLPKAVLGGKEFKPGEEVVLKVVKVMEDSVLVQYASESGETEEPPTEAAQPQQAPPPGGMASLMQ